MAIVVGMNTGAAKPMHDMTKRVKAMVEGEWRRTIEPGLDKASVAQKSPVVWQPRVTPPLPSQWPTEKMNLIFYGYARGVSTSLAGGEHVGRVWAKVVDSGGELKLTLISKALVPTNQVVGQRPLQSEESVMLALDPVELLRAPLTPAREGRIKSYYCLQKALGNIPDDAAREHAAFFKWLACKP
jgi:hypothetical protein